MEFFFLIPGYRLLLRERVTFIFFFRNDSILPENFHYDWSMEKEEKGLILLANKTRYSVWIIQPFDHSVVYTYIDIKNPQNILLKNPQLLLFTHCILWLFTEEWVIGKYYAQNTKIRKIRKNKYLYSCGVKKADYPTVEEKCYCFQSDLQGVKTGTGTSTGRDRYGL